MPRQGCYKMDERLRFVARLLDGGSETRPLARLNLLVAGDVAKKLLARRRDKTRPFHRVLRLASAKTFSAEKT